MNRIIKALFVVLPILTPIRMFAQVDPVSVDTQNTVPALTQAYSYYIGLSTNQLSAECVLDATYHNFTKPIDVRGFANATILFASDDPNSDTDSVRYFGTMGTIQTASFEVFASVIPGVTYGNMYKVSPCSATDGTYLGDAPIYNLGQYTLKDMNFDQLCIRMSGQHPIDATAKIVILLKQ